MLKHVVRPLTIVFMFAALSIGLPQRSLAANCATGGTIIDDTNTCISYSGTWAYGRFTDGAYNNSLHYSRTAGNTATLTFQRQFGDNYVYLRFRSGPDSGVARITLNGTVLGEMDLYSSSTRYLTNYYHIEYLPSTGTDTLQITVLNARNTRSTNTFISLDYLYFGL